MRIVDVKVINKHMTDGSTALVEVDTDEGIIGIGATSAPVPVVTALIEAGMTSLRTLLIGEDPTDTNRLWNKMYEGWQAQRGRGGVRRGGRQRHGSRRYGLVGYCWKGAGPAHLHASGRRGPIAGDGLCQHLAHE